MTCSLHQKKDKRNNSRKNYTSLHNVNVEDVSGDRTIVGVNCKR